MINTSKDYVRIQNQNEQIKLAKYATQNSDVLCRKTLILENGNFLQKDIDKLECNLPNNLLTIQFRKISQTILFNIESATNLINFQSKVANKIVVVPKLASFEEFNSLDSMMNEQYTLTLFSDMDEITLHSILDHSKKNYKVNNIEIFSRRGGDGIRKIAMLGKKYSNFFNMGIINIWANDGKNYSGTTPEIYFSNFGFTYFSKELMFNGRKPTYYKKFNLETCKYEIISEEQLKLMYGINSIEKLFCDNFTLINQKLNSFVSKSITNINSEVSYLGLNVQLNN
jgi:hypothetical protein